jgi:hypothetical protein
VGMKDGAHIMSIHDVQDWKRLRNPTPLTYPIHPNQGIQGTFWGRRAPGDEQASPSGCA